MEKWYIMYIYLRLIDVYNAFSRYINIYYTWIRHVFFVLCPIVYPSPFKATCFFPKKNRQGVQFQLAGVVAMIPWSMLLGLRPKHLWQPGWGVSFLDCNQAVGSCWIFWWELPVFEIAFMYIIYKITLRAQSAAPKNGYTGYTGYTG